LRVADAVLSLVPTDRLHVPALDARKRAAALLRALAPAADEVRAVVHDEVAFVDCGGNWSGVRCPACGADAEPWFADALAECHERSRLRELAAVAACCGASVSLDRLVFGWPVAFGRFALEARNPGLGPAGLSAEQLAAVGSAIGCPLVAVPARY
jgi:hypothetical protein